MFNRLSKLSLFDTPFDLIEFGKILLSIYSKRSVTINTVYSWMEYSVNKIWNNVKQIIIRKAFLSFSFIYPNHAHNINLATNYADIYGKSKTDNKEL